MANMKQCDRCGNIFEGAIPMCPSCGSTMVHEYTGEPEPEISDQVSGTEESINITQTADNGPVTNVRKDPEPAKVDHFSRKDKFALLTSHDIYWSFFLMEIPVIGWLLAGFWSFGIGIKRQRRELARAFLLRLLVSIILILVGLALYRWVFRLTLNDLPELISKGYEWLWQSVANLIERLKK